MVAGRRQHLVRRAEILRAVRQFFDDRDYLEVETPVRIPANAPEAHIRPVAAGAWFLQTSPELAMKRLLAEGYPRIYQITKVFRDGERGRHHLPELTLLEWYRTGIDYGEMMTETEALIRWAAGRVLGEERIIREGRPIDLTAPWPRLTLAEAFARFADRSPEAAQAEDRFEEILTDAVEPALARLGRPVFLIDYPIAQAALARRKPGQPDVAERFELYMGGLELCNAFSELTDPDLQRRRFEAEVARRERLDGTRPPIPEPFLASLGRMPAAAGNALGFDRLVMLLTGASSIDEVVAFTPEML